MPSLPPIPNLNVKVVFLIHFIFMSLSLMGRWHPQSYLFYNCLFILLLISSILNTQRQEHLQLAIVVNATSILLDILLLVMCFPTSDYARDRFSAAMAIFHLIIRPFSIYILVANLEERGGNTANISNMFTETRSESYEDLDRPSTQGTAQAGGHNYATAQPL
ncbi:type-1 angiotensin II receptor-associated protein [Cylas formicarius]|uniref:type-1 angiotensin II receptor-associated protein n=1 Tax=Cylas formicarius TaxID=197179 RepID=UPI0029584340|nr:type-1 angiotensin II receptor-associated protein [Cylas formicarius]